MTDELLAQVEAIKSRIQALAPLFPARAGRVAAALQRVVDALEERGPATVAELMERLDAREGVAGGNSYGTGVTAPPLTAVEEGALGGVRGVAERIAELHRQRLVRRFELAVEYYPPRREVVLVVLPGPGMAPMQRRPTLVFRLSPTGTGFALSAHPAGDGPAGSLDLAASPGQWRAREVESFVVGAVDRFLAGLGG